MNDKYTIESLIKRYPTLDVCKKDINDALCCIYNSFIAGNKLLIAGNGGSNSDAEHMAGELMKGFKLKRPIPPALKSEICKVDEELGKIICDKIQGSLPVISLSNHQSFNTAFINDVPNGGEFCFSQQVLSYGKSGDVFLAISTSGNSKNIINASIVAKALGMTVIALSGNNGGLLKRYADIDIIVPESETFLIQELHLPIYHFICLVLEERLFSNE